MHETANDIADLQQLLDASHARAGEYLKSIFNEDRRIGAEEVCRLLTGVNVIVVATAGASGTPLTSPVDGAFYRGEFYFGSSPDSVRLRHLRARPQASATHARGEDLAVIVHGEAEVVDFADAYHAGLRECLVEIYSPKYGHDWIEWAEDSAVYARIRARVMFTYEIHESVSDG